MTHLLITIEIQLSAHPAPQQMLDEIVSNVESCDCVAVSTCCELIDADEPPSARIPYPEMETKMVVRVGNARITSLGS